MSDEEKTMIEKILEKPRPSKLSPNYDREIDFIVMGVELTESHLMDMRIRIRKSDLAWEQMHDLSLYVRE